MSWGGKPETWDYYGDLRVPTGTWRDHIGRTLAKLRKNSRACNVPFNNGNLAATDLQTWQKHARLILGEGTKEDPRLACKQCCAPAEEVNGYTVPCPHCGSRHFEAVPSNFYDVPLTAPEKWIAPIGIGLVIALLALAYVTT